MLSSGRREINKKAVWYVAPGEAVVQLCLMKRHQRSVWFPYQRVRTAEYVELIFRQLFLYYEISRATRRIPENPGSGDSAGYFFVYKSCRFRLVLISGD